MGGEMRVFAVCVALAACVLSHAAGNDFFPHVPVGGESDPLVLMQTGVGGVDDAEEAEAAAKRAKEQEQIASKKSEETEKYAQKTEDAAKQAKEAETGAHAARVKAEEYAQKAQDLAKKIEEINAQAANLGADSGDEFLLQTAAAGSINDASKAKKAAQIAEEQLDIT